MFLGESTKKIDEKGRVPLPPRFRGELKEGMVLNRGVDQCIRIYPLSEWEKEKSKVSALPSNHRGRAYRRFIFAGAFNAEMDRIGRVPIPQLLRQYAGIKDDVVVTGQDVFIELWAPELWQSETKSFEDEAWQIAESLESGQLTQS